MKLNTIVLLAASALGVNVSALDISGYAKDNTLSVGVPTVLNEGYFSNDSGQVFKRDGSGYSQIYTMGGAALSATNGEYALGYITNTNHVGSNIFLCNIGECDNLESRKFIEGHDYYERDSLPYLIGANGVFSSGGNAVVLSRASDSDEYKLSSIDMTGNVLDSFLIKSKITYGNFGYNYVVGTTGITEEEDFKLLTVDHGEYRVKMKMWNSSSLEFEELNVVLSDGQDINSLYPSGIAPLAISNPIVSEQGDKIYTLVLAELAGDSTHKTLKTIMWGDITVDQNEAKFLSQLETATPESTVYLDNRLTPTFHSNNKLTFYNHTLDFSQKGEKALALSDHGSLIEERVYITSSTGEVALKGKYGGDYYIYTPNVLKLWSTHLDLDPYNSADFSISLLSLLPSYYGIEATCSLQTTNATVDSNNYIDLSETALQIPIEWDSVTGEWKGAQSLTGLESLSGSKDFAQFNLTADVTTGTWTMNCSGIASDIEGNKIELNPAEITINLDDQIHGGSSAISGQIQIPNTTDYSGVVVTITLNGRQIEVTTMEDGSFEFDRLVEGDYTVHVYSEQYVAACNNLTLDGTNAAAPLTIEMYAGDINNDGAVDIGDFSYLSSLYGLSSTDEQYDALADLNHDGTINVQDLSILGSHFGTDHCEVVPE